MNLCVRSAIWKLFLTAAIVCCGLEPALAVTVQDASLNAESIAVSSLSVAESMKSTGYCYAGVSKAMSPLGVTLTGEAAYQARELLLADSRFLPLSLDDSSDLRRGDIIVFNKSGGHPYGHISVYQGDGQESSDHVSQLTSPNAYGGVTVFRLRSENYAIASNGAYSNGNIGASNLGVGGASSWTYRMPLTAPDFRGSNQPGSYLPLPTDRRGFGSGDTKNSGIVKDATALLKRHFPKVNSATSGKALTKKLFRFVMENL